MKGNAKPKYPKYNSSVYPRKTFITEREREGERVGERRERKKEKKNLFES